MRTTCFFFSKMGNNHGKNIKRGTNEKSQSSTSLKHREDDIENLSRWMTAETRRNKDIIEETYDAYKVNAHRTFTHLSYFHYYNFQNPATNAFIEAYV